MSTLTVKELSHPAGEVIKIAAGKTLDLKSQGSVTMPTGSVLQVVQTYSAGRPSALSTSSVSWVASGIIATITPKYVGSKILVSWTNSMSDSTGFGFAKMYVYDGGWAGMAGANNYHIGYSNPSHNSYTGNSFNGNFVTTDLNTLSFQPFMYASTGVYHFLHASSSYALTLTEIAQ